ncbi:MAG TPA: Holliday junction resolvase RuvX [Gammaproteobacteria bacterium]|nr:Holliday junction resolvase RuvX [Gammaproteobacteria bacterium]
MNSATYLGFDYGTKRIGIAVGNTVSVSATALDTIQVRNGQPDWGHISLLITEWQPDALVVGWPIQMDNSDNPVTPRARRFGNQLNGRYSLPVHHVDERLSTHVALSEIREAGYNSRRSSGLVDSYAAREILQTFLNGLVGNDKKD